MDTQHNKKRILIFSLVYYPNFIGGAEVAIKEITDRLGRDFEFDMVTLHLDSHLPKVERIGNVTVYRVGWTSDDNVSPDSLPKSLHLNKYAMLVTGFWQAMKLQRKHKYDVVWSMMATYNSFAALFFKLLNPKIKFLLTLQEGDPIPFIKRRARPLWPLFKMIFTHADTIQAISKYLADFGVDMGARCPVVVVPNAVDIKHFTREYSESEINEVKNKLNKKEACPPSTEPAGDGRRGDIFLITTSRLVTKNAVEDIVKAMPLLPENIKLIIGGRGYLEDSIRKLSVMLRVENRIQFLGWLTHNDMPKYLKASDIFIRVPISEGFGNSFVEAMACGLPCVTTPVGGILDFLRDRETGIFANVRDPQSVASAVLELVRNPELVSKIKRQSFEMVKEKYDWPMIAEEMKKIFNNI
ncbi:MAG: glycosyltransferase family 4 protein [Patescibacteria group bacterium]